MIVSLGLLMVFFSKLESRTKAMEMAGITDASSVTVLLLLCFVLVVYWSIFTSMRL